MNYATVFSGVEAPSLAWGGLGWTPLFFSEIEPYASKVLAHRYPDVPNLGDMLHIDGAAWRGKIDVLFGGSPCQAFSVAGQRGSLDDDRGNLTLKFAELAHDIDPGFLIWENVPGVLSTPDNAFGCFLAGLVGADAPLCSPYQQGRWPNAGMVAGSARTVAWRVFDAQYFGVAQMRRRVFVVSGRAGDYRCAQILFEPEGLRGDTPTRRKKGQEIAGTIGGGSDRDWNSNLDTSGAFIPEVVSAVTSKWAKGSGGPAGDEVQNLVSFKQRPEGEGELAYDADVARCLDGFGGWAPNQGGNVVLDYRVRRLTPRECERLMGFSDDYTLVPGGSDSARYRVIGNSIVVPVLRWIGQRIAEVGKE